MPVSKDELEKSAFSIERKYMKIVEEKDKLIKDLRMMITRRNAIIETQKRSLKDKWMKNTQNI